MVVAKPYSRLGYPSYRQFSVGMNVAALVGQMLLAGVCGAGVTELPSERLNLWRAVVLLCLMSLVAFSGEDVYAVWRLLA